MKKILLFGLLLTGMAFTFSCSKPGSESTNVSTPPLQIGQTISTSTHSGTVKGTMTSGNTYTITGDLTINRGDTLLIQSNVKVEMGPGTFINVKGTLISLGTKDNPNYITSPTGKYICDLTTPQQSDPAYAGLWGGIYCDSSCKALVLKWTHIEFAGGAVVNPAVQGSSAGDAYSMYFVNPNGYIVLEDDWFYGGVDDFFRIQSGIVAAYRNTFIKNSAISGDCLNAKNGSVGDMAYNFFIGTCTNGTKASNKGAGGQQTNISMYNNTYINGGYRQTQTGRSGAIDYEQGAKGFYYNNLCVDCKFGPRVVINPTADTANMKYGYTFQYGDDTSITNEFYPVAYITVPKSTDIPNPGFLPSGYKIGGKYDGTSLVGKNNPMFVNYPLPNKSYIETTCPEGFDFHLQSSSPCIGKGFTGFSPLKLVPMATAKNPVGVTEYTMPGSDIGCYQSNGSGNQHTTW